MREKCARVLAAALMTGAIGFALAMPALFGTGHDAGRSLTAPPSFLQRSVHVVASAPSRSAGTARLDKSRLILSGVFLQVGRSGATADGGNPASTRHPDRASGSKDSKPPPKPAPKPTTPSPTPTPAPTPAPAPAPAPDTRGLATSTTPVAAPAPSRPAENAKGGNGKGKGKGKGHDKNKDEGGKGAEPTQAAAPAATPQPANELPPTEGGKDHGRDEDKDRDKNKDQDKDKGKSDDKGRNG